MHGLRGRVLRAAARAGIVAAAAAALLLVLTVATPQGRTAAKTGGFIFQVLPSVPVKPLAWFTRGPTRHEVLFAQAYGEGLADVYRPAGDGRHAAVLLFLGVNPAGRNDERVVNLAEGLARSGMVVMVPWSESMTQYRIDPAEVDNLVNAFLYLQGREYVDPERVGMGGFCVGASLSAVAAQDARIRDNVAFVNFFGGYFDSRDLLVSVASRARFGEDGQQEWEPSDQTLRTFRNHLIDSLDSADERELLTRVFVNGEEPALAEVASLSDTAEAAYGLMSGATVEEARELLSRLPARFQDEMDRVSPSKNIGNLKARVLVMHDTEDNNVPSEESRRLTAALEERGNVRHTEFVFFQHMDPARAVNPLTWTVDALKLFLHMYNVVRVAS